MIDDIDRRIVKVLNENARRSFRDLAKEVGISVTAVINKVKKLEESGAIKGYIPILDPEYFGYSLMAIIALRLSKGKLLETQELIAREPQVVAVYDITGEWDSLVIGYFRHRQDLNRFIKKILSYRYVDRSVTHLVLNVVKDEKRLPLL
ncbi:MAG: Lrp/AsnC family transcriptional regulator [Candidatus Aminicenantes bacterium]|nr:Lrp/AsnC family transcriptional regulator [Candidatus Aminicenantes bacterium]